MLVLAAIAIIGGLHEIMLRKDILMVVPLLTKRHWFITVYVALCILAPYLNILVNAMSKLEFKRLLTIGVCLFVVLPTLAGLFNSESITAHSGYGFINFMLLYLMGRYMRLHKVPQRSSYLYFSIYVLSMAACGLFQIVYSHILGFEFTTFLSYDTLFVFAGAIALLCAFSRLMFKNKFVNTLASVCFAVYIIHMHPWFGSWTFEKMIGLKSVSDRTFIAAIYIVPIITYLGCFVLEYARANILKRLIITPRNFKKCRSKE